jgi:hypothetical protein
MSSMTLDVEQSSLQLWSMEIAKASAELEQLEKGIKGMLDDPNVQMGLVIRKNAERAELHAYLRGLKFLAPLLDPSLI